MSNRNEFRGSIKINGVVESELVSVFFTSHSHELLIRGTDGEHLSDKKLILHPFGIFMLREFQSEAMKAGFHYSISGTKVGNFSRGPLGHPGDGEYDSRPIRKFDVHSKYTKKDLTVKIEGVTEVGTSGFQLFQKKSLPSWNFQVNFVVPRSEMKSFFGIDDFNYPYFESLLDACG